MQFPPMSLALSNTGDRARLLDYTLGTLRSKELFRSTDLRKLSDSLSDVLNDPATMADYAYGRDSFLDLLINIRARHESGAAPARGAHRRRRTRADGTPAFCSVRGGRRPDLVNMAAGIQQLRRELREAGMPDQLELQEWLDPFYRGRIGIRLLINHHIGEAARRRGPRGARVWSPTLGGAAPRGRHGAGSAQQRVAGGPHRHGRADVQHPRGDRARSEPRAVHLPAHLPDGRAAQGPLARRAGPRRATPALTRARVGRRARGAPTQVNYHGSDKIVFPYVPSVLYYMCFELFKNSLRATVEHHHLKHGRECPGTPCACARAASMKLITSFLPAAGCAAPRCADVEVLVAAGGEVRPAATRGSCGERPPDTKEERRRVPDPPGASRAGGHDQAVGPRRRDRAQRHEADLVVLAHDGDAALSRAAVHCPAAAHGRLWLRPADVAVGTFFWQTDAWVAPSWG